MGGGEWGVGSGKGSISNIRDNWQYSSFIFILFKFNSILILEIFLSLPYLGRLILISLSLKF